MYVILLVSKTKIEYHENEEGNLIVFQEMDEALNYLPSVKLKKGQRTTIQQVAPEQLFMINLIRELPEYSPEDIEYVLDSVYFLLDEYAMFPGMVNLVLNTVFKGIDSDNTAHCAVKESEDQTGLTIFIELLEENAESYSHQGVYFLPYKRIVSAVLKVANVQSDEDSATLEDMCQDLDLLFEVIMRIPVVQTATGDKKDLSPFVICKDFTSINKLKMPQYYPSQDDYLNHLSEELTIPCLMEA